ncbi:MAG: hypothetical protein ACETWM_08055 [Candidatus Lokiarchaeia archaeon]
MTSRKKFTDDELRRLHSQGLIVKEIAERLEVSEATVLKRAERLGLDLRRKLSDEQPSQDESENVSEKRRRDKNSFLPPPSGGPPM